MTRPRRANALAIVAAAMIAAATPALTKEPETPVPAPAFSELRDSFRAQTDHEARAALIPQIEAAAEGGNSWAMLLLGDALARGEGVSADAALALVWYKRAAETGNVQALLRLGAAYRDGLLVPADPARAIAVYEKAIEAGSTRAAVLLGEGHVNRHFGRLSNPAKGIRLIERAHAEGEPTAAASLANFHIWGRGVRRDPSKALALLTEAADGGNASAARALIGHYRAGRGEFIPRNLSRANAALEKYAPLLAADELERERFLMDAAGASGLRDFSRLADQLDRMPADRQADAISALRAASPNAYVYVVQRRLAAKGLYHGRLNGRLTRPTIRAIKMLCRQDLAADRCEAGPLDHRAAQLIARLIAG